MSILENVIKLCNYINFVYDNNTGLKYTGKFEAVLYKSKYSSSLQDSIRLKNNGDILPVRNVRVEYICPNCKNINNILLLKFLFKDSLNCKKCASKDEEKRRKHSHYLKKSIEEFGKIVSKNKNHVKKFKELNSSELIEMSDTSFEKETEDFKLKYFSKNPTTEEFEKIKNKIKINNFDMDKIKFYPHIKTTHSNRYSPKIMDENGNLHLLSRLTFICDSCGSEFEGRNFKQRSNDYKILCKDCKLCNKTFKVRYTKNIKNELIRYQSSPELDLINFCNYNSILIQNGPKINYIFNERQLKYNIDFKIKKMLIEIKDNHIWHRNEINTGKWAAKELGAIKYCEENNLEFKLVMKSDVKSLKDYILRYMWI